MRALLPLALAAGFLASSWADGTRKDRPQGPPPDFRGRDVTGYYAMAGQAAKGRYSGVCLIRREKGVLIVEYHTPGQVVTGVGILHGDKLSVGWAAPAEGALNGIARGVTVYTVAGPRLTGLYLAAPGPGRAFQEVLTRLPGVDAPEGD